MGRKEGKEGVASESPWLLKHPSVLHTQQRWLAPVHAGLVGIAVPVQIRRGWRRREEARAAGWTPAAMATDAGSAAPPPPVSSQPTTEGWVFTELGDGRCRCGDSRGGEGLEGAVETGWALRAGLSSLIVSLLPFPQTSVCETRLEMPGNLTVQKGRGLGLGRWPRETGAVVGTL